MTFDFIVSAIAGLIFVPVLLLWVLYVLTMRFKRLRDRRGLRLHEKIVGVPIATLGYLVDVYVHLVPATVVLLDAPRIMQGEYTLTARFQRYLDGDEYDWRKAIARWWKPKLNKHDADHLK